MKSLPRLVLLALAFALPLTAEDKPAAFTAKDGEIDGIPVKELSYGGKKVAAFVDPKFDAALSKVKGAELKNPTFKPYVHLYDFDKGETRLTNGPEGQYPHHRGLFFGFNKISYGGKTVDCWHCRNGASQQVADAGKFEIDGPMAKLVQTINWCGTDGKPFAEEKRGFAFTKAPVGLKIDFTSTVTPLDGPVKFDGDPQHAGFHIRLNSNEVEKKTAKQTYFIRPDGKGEAGKELNWNPKGKGEMVNLPWDAMSSVIDGQRYTFLMIDHPDNPKESRHSERTYGRMGSYFEYEATKEKPLVVKYRVWAVKGELTPDQCKELGTAFVGGK